MNTKEINVTLLSVKEPYAYDFKGKQGISYSATFMIGENIMPIKISKEQYDEMKDYKNEDGTAVFTIGIFNNAVESKLRLASFVN